MVKKPFLFAQLAIFLHNPILHYVNSLWIKKTTAETVYCLWDYDFKLFYYNNSMGLYRNISATHDINIILRY